MAANGCSALRTFPNLLLFLQEPFDAVFLYKFKVLNHAHPEVGSVALIYLVKLLAGIISTLVTILHFTFKEQIASFFEEGTLPVSGSATWAVGHSDPFALDIIFLSKISTAYAAIHSARSD